MRSRAEQLALLALALAPPPRRRRARASRQPRAQVGLQRVHVREVLAELRGVAVDVALEDGHAAEYATGG